MTTRENCYFCNREFPETIDAAVREGWVPGFYEPGEAHETLCPVCPECFVKHLEIGEDGELERVTD